VPIDTSLTGNQQSISDNLSSATHYISADVSSTNPSEQLEVALGLAVQLPHSKTQVFTKRHSDHQAIFSTSSNIFMMNQVNNDLHLNQCEPSPYQNTTFFTQYSDLNEETVGASDNLSTYNRYIFFSNVSVKPHYSKDSYSFKCSLYNLHNMTNTSEQPELTSVYNRDLSSFSSDSLNTSNVFELVFMYESDFEAPLSDYGYFASVFDTGFIFSLSDYGYFVPVFDDGLSSSLSDPFNTANVSMQSGFT